MLQSVVTKILVGPDPGLLNTRARHVSSCRAHALTGTHGVALRFTKRTFTSYPAPALAPGP